MVSVWVAAAEDVPTVKRPSAWMDLARQAHELMMQGRLGEAEDLFDDALQLTDNADATLQVLCGRARLVVMARRASEACALADKMRDLLGSPECSSTAPWGYAWISQLLLLANRVDEAISAAEEAVRVAENTGLARAEAYGALAAARERAGDVSGAMDSLERAMMYMTNPKCLMNARADHARLALLAGDTASAVRSLTRAVELPDFRDRQAIANVLSSIARLGAQNPTEAVQLVETLAVHLSRF